MKHLILKEEKFIAIHKAFKDYLKSKGYKEATQKQLASHTQEFLFHMEQKAIHRIDWIEPQHIQAHYQYLVKRPNYRREGGLSGTMLEHNIYAIRTFFVWLVKLEAVEVNPISGLDFPKSTHSPRIALQKESVLKLFEVAESYRDKAILSLYYGCGLRRAEGEALNRTDIDFNQQKLIVRKGKFSKRREIPLHESILEHLRKYWQYERPSYIRNYTDDNMKAFLVNNIGNRLRGNSSNKRIKELAQKAELKEEVTLHVLRHSIATHLKENGMGLEQIQEFLGHSSLDVTQAYIEGYKIRWKRKQYRRY